MSFALCTECQGAGVMFGTTTRGGHDLECPQCDGTGAATSRDWDHFDEFRYHLIGLGWVLYDALHFDTILKWLTKRITR